MPNWCSSTIKVFGKPKDIENFCKLFIFTDDENKEEVDKKYFARSFTQMSWEDFKKKYLGEYETEFLVDFAWSCWSCIFEGYPDNKECVTLEWAMEEYKVQVEIDTEEGGMGFEEHITTENGKPVYSSEDMLSYECQKCGNKELIPSSYDLEDYECSECGASEWIDKLVKILEEKIENGNCKQQ
jgi:ribosomal protein L37E